MSQLQVSGEAKIRDIQGPVVANSGVITALDGAASQYVRGDGTLADFPTSTGGGSSVSYYLNGSVNQGTFAGSTYYEMSKTPIIGAGTDFPVSTNGLVSQFITDANDPDLLEVPGGNFNVEFYFSVNNNTGNPTVYAELYKYDGTTFTLLGSSQAIPESINQGTTIAPYYFAIPVGTAALALTDRIAIRIYANVDGRTVTLHTENSHLCQVVTTFSKGMVSLNNLTDQSQFITTGTSGTNFNIVSSGDTHTFNLPVASATNTGKLSSTDWSTFNNKVPYTGATGNVDLGLFGLTSNAVKAIGDNSTYGGVISIKQNNVIGGLIGTGYTELFGKTNRLGISFGAGSIAYLSNSVLTAERTYTLPDLSGTLALLEGTQTFSGAKTFTSTFGTQFDYGIYSPLTSKFDQGIIFLKGTVPTIFSTITTNLYTESTSNNLVIQDQNSKAKLLFDNSTQTYTFPATSGTLALTSNLSAYVPYTGATSAVNLGTNNLIAKNTLADGLLINQSGSGSVVAGYTTIRHQTGSGIFGFLIDNSNTGVSAQLLFNNATSYEYTFPNASGTIALTSNLSSYVPYTGATANVDLGIRALFAQNIVVGQTSTQGYIHFKTGGSTAISADTCQAPYGTNGMIYSFDQTGGNYKQFVIDSSSLTNNTIRTYTMPDATGTLALTSNLSAYLPLTGGTLTGNLTINPSTTDYTLTVSTSTTNNTIKLLGSTASNTSTIGYWSSNGGTGYGALNFTPTNTRFEIVNGGSFSIYTSGNERLTVASGGTTTLTGALSGTSATFSSSVATNGASAFSGYGLTTKGTYGLYVQRGSVNDSGIEIYHDGTNAIINSTYQSTGSFGGMLLYAGGSPRLTITSGGNISIGSTVDSGFKTYIKAGASGILLSAGTTSSDNTLLIQNAAETTTLFNIKGNGAATFNIASGGYGLTLNGPSYGGLILSNGGTANSYFVGESSLLSIEHTTAINLRTNNGNRVRITSAGNVGIGTDSPAAKLEIQDGHVRLYDPVSTAGAGYAVIWASNNGGTNSSFATIEGVTTSAGNRTGDIKFNTSSAGAPTEKMRITSDGNVLIGKSTTGVDTNGFRFDSNGVLFTSVPTGESTYYLRDTTNAVYRFYVTSGGTINATNTTISAISDVRLKENITDLQIGLDAIMALRPRQFDWKKESGNDGKNVRGFIAQEFEEVFPDLIDESINKTPEGEPYKQIRQDLIPILVKAIQELKAEIDELKNK